MIRGTPLLPTGSIKKGVPVRLTYETYSCYTTILCVGERKIMLLHRSPLRVYIDRPWSFSSSFSSSV